MSQTCELADAFRELRTRIERQMEDAEPERKPGLARALARVKRQEKESRRHVSRS